MAIIDWEDETPQEKTTQVALTDQEMVAVLQLINDCVSDRKCDENELGYMGLLNLLWNWNCKTIFWFFNSTNNVHTINDTKNEKDLNELVNLLKNQIHTYDLLVFHSISMITSLVDSDLITFYQIYECFDQLGVFNSNWENEVSDKLTDIGDGIKDLMYSIYKIITFSQIGIICILVIGVA